MKIETLISTMNKTTFEFLEKMNIQTNCIVANQNGNSEFETFNYGELLVTHIQSKDVGLSKNRNISLKASTADIAIIADDDIEYLPNLKTNVEQAYKNNPNADIIIFNLLEEENVRFKIQKKMNISYRNFMRFGSVRITFKVASVRSRGILFDERFGAGGEIPIGEDTIFLYECLKNGLNIVALPIDIVRLTNDRESTWFRGYTVEYFKNKGKLYQRINKKIYKLLCLQDAIRHRKKYREFGTILKVFNTMVVDNEL